MGTSSVDLRNTLTAHGKNERRFTFAEVVYWLDQYRDLSRRAVNYAELVDKKLNELQSFYDSTVRLYEELRNIIDGGSESMTHEDAVKELRSMLKDSEELAKLREQKPVTFVFDPNGYAIDGKHTEIADALPIGMDLYAAPIPALAVLAPSVPEGWRAGLSRLLDTFERCEAGFPPHVELRFAVRDEARALLQSAPQTTTPGPQVTLPPGWEITRHDDDTLIDKHSEKGGAAVYRNPKEERTAPEALLFDLAEDFLQSAPQTVAYGIDEEAARRIALAVHDYQNRISDEPLLYAINRILIKEVHPLSAEGLAEVQSAENKNG